MCGMLFSLSIFAMKVGFGLSLGGIKWRGMVLTLSLYLMSFVLVAVLSEQIAPVCEPVLKKGPYLHGGIALGMVAWGIYLLKTQRPAHSSTMTRAGSIRDQNRKPVTEHPSGRASLLLLIPCPVCLTAIAFSTWAALAVIKFPPFFVGMGLGLVFIALSLIIFFFLKLITHSSSPMTQRINLGLSMIAIGLYFILSLFLPAKIEEAKGVYQSFLIENWTAAFGGDIGVFFVLFAGMVIGFLRNGKRELSKKPSAN